MLIDANLKLLLINMHASIDTHVGGTYSVFNGLNGYTDDIYNGDGYKISLTTIPFPLEVDINNFNLYGELDKLLGIKDFVNVGNVVSNIATNISINTLQKAALANSSSLLSLAGVPTNDTMTRQNASLVQQPTGQKLQLRIIFEPKSLLAVMLYAYLQAAAKNIKAFTFTYISNELVATNLVLGSVKPDFSSEHTVMDIVFTEQLPASSNGLSAMQNPQSNLSGQQNIL